MYVRKTKQNDIRYYVLYPEQDEIAYWGRDHMITSQNVLDTGKISRTKHPYPITNSTYDRYQSLRLHENNVIAHLEISLPLSWIDFFVVLPYAFFDEVIDPLPDAYDSFMYRGRKASCYTTSLFGPAVLASVPFKRLFSHAGLDLGREIIDDWQMRTWGSCWTRKKA